MAGGSGPALGGAEEAGAGTAGRARGAGGGGGAPEPPPRVNAGFLLFGEVRARGGAGCRPGPLAVSGGCPLECVRVEAETNLGSRASECACGGFALALPLPAEDPDPSEPPPRLLGRVTARQRCYLDCEEGDVGSLQTNVGPDGAEAFCYEEFSVDRWVRAEGDFFKRVDFNLSESDPPPLPGVTYLSPTGALGVGLPDPPCALPAAFWGSFLALHALAILQAWIMGRSFLSTLRSPESRSVSEGTTEKSSGPSSAAPVSGGSDGELFLEIPSVTGTDEGTQGAEHGIDSTWRSAPFSSAEILSARRLAPWASAPDQHR